MHKNQLKRVKRKVVNSKNGKKENEQIDSKEGKQKK